MSAINDLQNLAGKIEELKDKLTDEEYKDLLELSHKYYDKEKTIEEKKKPRMFVEYIHIEPICHYATYDPYADWDQDGIGEFTGGENFINEAGSENYRVSCRLSLKKEKKLKEVKEGYQHTLGDMEMNKATYDALKEKGHIISKGATMIYVSTKIIN